MESEPLYKLKAEFFKTLAHPARIRILELLVERDRSVGELLSSDVGLESSNGKALRQAIIIRALGVERLVRAVVLALAAWAVWEFRGARGAIQATLDRDLPVLRAAGFKVDQMTVIHALEKALAAKPSTLALITGMLAAYAVLQAVEGVGLWLLKRWGEYFAVVATSIFLPLEVHDLAKGITTTRVVTFSINVAAVVYLLISKRLFGVRGGRKAYDVERRGEQLLDLERAAMLT